MHLSLFKRRTIWLLVGLQTLLACSAGALSIVPISLPPVGPPSVNLKPANPHLAYPTSDNWPVASQSTQAQTSLLMKPNFNAPSAEHCARPIRSKEIPGLVAQTPSYGTSPAAVRHKKIEPMLEKSSAESALIGTVSKPSRVAPSASPAISLASVAAPVAATAAAASSVPTPAPTSVAPVVARAEMASPARLTPPTNSYVPPQPAVSQIVTAGVVDDNANFSEYLAFRNRTQVQHRPRDIAERYLLQVKDSAGHSVADAEVWVQAPSGAAMWARTDAGGQVWISPNAFDTTRASTYQINVRKQAGSQIAKQSHSLTLQATGFLQRGQKSAVEVTLDAPNSARAQLDLVFLIDATGSMQDEIDKLKSTLDKIANDVASLPSHPDLCFGLVAYRDKTDEFLIRSHDFTNDLSGFRGVLNQLQADGGGDYPEAMNEALNETVHNLSWRGNGTSRMVFLIADAPPHLDYGGPQYDDDMMAALGKGIKIFSVGASGLDKQGEFIQRQIAQYTGGKFVFLTYDKATNPASGPGRETVHDVNNYGVDTLDRLITRLVREELAKLARS